MHNELELATRRMFSSSDICLKVFRSLKNLRHDFQIQAKICIGYSKTHDSYATISVNLVIFYMCVREKLFTVNIVIVRSYSNIFYIAI